MESILDTLVRGLSVITLCTSMLFSSLAYSQTDQEEPEPASQQEQEKKEEQEEETEKLDLNRGRFLPIPVFITEPALGEGLGVALAYFHRVKENPKELTVASTDTLLGTKENKKPPATISGIFAGATSNGTKALGFGHINSFLEDTVRYTGLVMAADINTEIYLASIPFDFNLDGLILYQDAKFRVGESDWFMGGGLAYLDATTTLGLDLPVDVPGNLIAGDITNIGMSGKILWDRRDNSSMPTKGQLFDSALWRYDDAIGSDFSYWNATMKFHSFHPYGEKFVLGLRVDYSATEGNPPFFAIPYVKMRGIPALRFQGDRVASFEIDARYNLSPKWIGSVFAGLSSTDSGKIGINKEGGIRAFGVGVRRKIFEAQNVWFGIDLAKGPEEAAWYIQVGHGW